MIVDVMGGQAMVGDERSAYHPIVHSFLNARAETVYGDSGDTVTGRRPRTPVEHVIELGQHRVDHHPDPTKRMIHRDQLLRAQRHQHRQIADQVPHA